MFLSLEGGSLAEPKKSQRREVEGDNLKESSGKGTPGELGKQLQRTEKRKRVK